MSANVKINTSWVPLGNGSQTFAQAEGLPARWTLRASPVPSHMKQHQPNLPKQGTCLLAGCFSCLCRKTRCKGSPPLSGWAQMK